MNINKNPPPIMPASISKVGIRHWDIFNSQNMLNAAKKEYTKRKKVSPKNRINPIMRIFLRTFD